MISVVVGYNIVILCLWASFYELDHCLWSCFDGISILIWFPSVCSVRVALLYWGVN